MNKSLTFELAKLLKEKGLNFKTDEHYSSETKVTSSSYNEIPAPTISEVVTFIYEKKGIWISVQTYTHKNKLLFKYVITSLDFEKLSLFVSSPTEAYESAIKYILKKLI